MRDTPPPRHHNPPPWIADDPVKAREFWAAAAKEQADWDAAQARRNRGIRGLIRRTRARNTEKTAGHKLQGFYFGPGGVPGRTIDAEPPTHAETESDHRALLGSPEMDRAADDPAPRSPAGLGRTHASHARPARPSSEYTAEERADYIRGYRDEIAYFDDSPADAESWESYQRGLTPHQLEELTYTQKSAAADARGQHQRTPEEMKQQLETGAGWMEFRPQEWQAYHQWAEAQVPDRTPEEIDRALKTTGADPTQFRDKEWQAYEQWDAEQWKQQLREEVEAGLIEEIKPGWPTSIPTPERADQTLNGQAEPPDQPAVADLDAGSKLLPSDTVLGALQRTANGEDLDTVWNSLTAQALTLTPADITPTSPAAEHARTVFAGRQPVELADDQDLDNTHTRADGPTPRDELDPDGLDLDGYPDPRDHPEYAGEYRLTDDEHARTDNRDDFDFWRDVIGDDLVVDGVAYSAHEWEYDGEGGVQRLSDERRERPHEELDAVAAPDEQPETDSPDSAGITDPQRKDATERSTDHPEPAERVAPADHDRNDHTHGEDLASVLRRAHENSSRILAERQTPTRPGTQPAPDNRGVGGREIS